MNSDSSSLALAIGERIKNERKLRRLTLDQLAEAAGVSRRMLVNVEHGLANPSVGILLRISDVLGVGLPALVEPPRPKPLKVTRRGAGALLWSGEYGGKGVLLVGTERPDVVELWNWTLSPGDRHTSEAHTPGTQELVHVQKGTVVVEIAGEVVSLNAGDAAAFPGDLPHSYSSAGKEVAHFTMTVFDPKVGSRVKEEM